MPFALGIIGILLIVAGARGTYGDLKNLLMEDFTGSGNFFYWIIALGVAGSAGYVPGLEKVSRAFMALLIISMILANGRNGGFFQKFTQALQSVQAASKASQGAESAAELQGWYKGAFPSVFGERKLLPSLKDIAPGGIDWSVFGK